ncbi:MAG: hypothetical protein R3D71_05805 [Rickettsiales bacterium]
MESIDEFYWDKQLGNEKTLVISPLVYKDDIEYDCEPFSDGFGLHLMLFDRLPVESDTVDTFPKPKVLAKFVSEDAVRSFVRIMSFNTPC